MRIFTKDALRTQLLADFCMKGPICGESLRACSVCADFSPEILLRHFTLYHEYKSGGSVWLMKRLNPFACDYNDLLSIARIWAQGGREVIILAPVHFKDELYPIVFGPLIGTRYDWKCPDLLVDGLYYEYESFTSPWKKSKLSNMLKNGLKQAPRLIIDNNKGCSLRFYRNRIKSRENKNDSLVELWIYEKGNLKCLFKRNGDTQKASPCW